MSRLQGYVTVKYRAENLKDPAVKQVLDYFDAVGLPAYVILAPPAADTEGNGTRAGDG